MQMLKYLRNNLSLRRTILLLHRPIYQFDYVSIKMRYKMLQIFSMRFWIQTFSSYPFYCVSIEFNVIKINKFGCLI